MHTVFLKWNISDVDHIVDVFCYIDNELGNRISGKANVSTYGKAVFAERLKMNWIYNVNYGLYIYQLTLSNLNYQDEYIFSLNILESVNGSLKVNKSMTKLEVRGMVIL